MSKNHVKQDDAVTSRIPVETSGSFSLYLVSIAMFMIWLIVTLPVAHAASLQSVTVRAASVPDTMDNIVPSGKTQVTVTTSVIPENGETAQSIQSRLFLGSVPFGICKNADDGVSIVCTSTREVDTTLILTNPFAMWTYLYKDAANIGPDDMQDYGSPKSLSLYYDALPPNVTIQSVKQVGRALALRLEGRDFLSNENRGYDVCAGMHSIFVQLDTIAVYAEQLSGACEYSASIMIDIPDSIVNDGQPHQLCMKSADVFNHTSGFSCIPVTLDLRPPTIRDIKLTVDDGASAVAFINPSGQDAYLVFNVSDMVTSTIGVGITAPDGTDSGTVSAVCDGVACKSGPFFLSGPGSYGISVVGFDDAGNNATVSTSQMISTDLASPILERLDSTVRGGGYSYVSGISTLFATINEAQSGLDASQMMLSISGSKYSATSCKRIDGSRMQCVWSNVPVSAPEGDVFATVSGNDRAGNPITGNPSTIDPSGLTQLLRYDSKAPLVTSLSYVAVSDAGESNITSSHNRLKLTVGYTDASSIRLFGNFSLLGAEERIEGSCNSSSSSGGICTLTSGPIGTGPFTYPIYLTTNDAAGNNATFMTAPIMVHQTVNTSDIKFFTHGATVSPAAFELTTAQYINQRGYARINIKPRAEFSAAHPTSSTFIRCYSPTATGSTSAAVGDMAYFKSVKRIDVADPSVMLLQFDLKAVAISNKTSLAVKCDFDVSGIYGTSFIPHEQQTAYLSWSMYSMKAGEVSESYQDEYDKAYKSAKSGIAGKVKTFTRFFDLASKLCRVFKVVFQVLQFFGVMGVAVKSTADGLKNSPYTKGIAKFLDNLGRNMCSSEQKTRDLSKSGLEKGVTGICQFINCEWSLTGALLNKGKNTGGLGGIMDSGQSSVSYTGKTDSTGSLSVGGNVQSVLTDKAGGGENGVGKYMGLNYIDTKSNLIWSVMNLCIPGILYNLEQARQIECKYAICLRDEVPSGIPKQACDAAKGYSQCVFLFGQIMNALPFVAMYNHIIDQFKSLVSNPFALVGVALQYGICSGACPKPYAAGAASYSLCLGVHAVAELGSMIQNVISIKDSFTPNQKGSTADYCKELGI